MGRGAVNLKAHTVSELRCCLLYGLYLGLLGFPATLSLCLLLEMCCNNNNENKGKDTGGKTVNHQDF